MSNSYSNPWGTAMEPEPPGETAAEASLRFRLQEVQRKELELRIRESRLNEREEKLEEIVKRAPNWPPFRPIVYHDIQKEIPEHGRMLVKKLYFTWLFSTWTFFFNCIACFSCLVTKQSAGGSNFGLSFLIMLIGIPMSWSFWYRQAYDGVKNDRSLNFFFFFFNFFAHIAAIGILLIGIPGWGGAGVITTLEQFGNNIVSAIFCAIATICFGFLLLLSIWQLKNTISFYRSRGMSMQQAQTQAIQGIAQSNVGQQVAKQAAQEVFVSQRQSRVV